MRRAGGAGYEQAMTKSKRFLAVFLAMATIAFWYLGRPPANPERSTSVPQTHTAETRPGSSPAVATPPATTVLAPPEQDSSVTRASQDSPREAGDAPGQSPAPPAEIGGPPAKVPEEQAIDRLRLTVRNYGQRFRGNPVGSNAEITAALNGGNPKGVRYLDELGARVNAKGELIDEWDTPYFFHQLSGSEMEIHSAGPDRKMGTSDDIVVK